MSDKAGDRFKRYESMAESCLLDGIPVVARLDGKSHHTFTRGLDKPFDVGYCQAMTDTAIALVRDACPDVAYVQSDEITLVWLDCDYFDRRVQKMSSVLSSIATLAFNESKKVNIPKKISTPAYFDCRVFQVPTRRDALRCLVWRQDDAVRNSIQALAQSLYSPAELHGRHAGELQELTFARGANWNDVPERFKRGVFVRRVERTTMMTEAEKAALPPKHAARSMVGEFAFTRSTIEPISIPPLRRIANAEGVVFYGEEPVPL